MQCYDKSQNQSMLWNTEQVELYTDNYILWLQTSYPYWKVMCCGNWYIDKLLDAGQWVLAGN